MLLAVLWRIPHMAAPHESPCRFQLSSVMGFVSHRRTTGIMAIGLVYDGHAQHLPPASARAHIETPERVSVIYRALGKARLLDRLTRVAPREATRAEAEAVHTAEHLDALEALADAEPSLRGAWRGGAGGGWSLGRDMFHDAQTACAARRAAGGVVALTEAVLRGEISSGFALVRPPGHHACEDRMAGFCLVDSSPRRENGVSPHVWLRLGGPLLPRLGRGRRAGCALSARRAAAGARRGLGCAPRRWDAGHLRGGPGRPLLLAAPLRARLLPWRGSTEPRPAGRG